MVKFTSTVLLALAVVVSARPSPQLATDPSGDGNIGNGQGQQFITGACLSNADCGSGCCAGLNGGGICSGPAVGNAQGKTGCGFGGEDDGLAALPPTTDDQQEDAIPEDADAGFSGDSGAGAENVGAGNASQFITGQCLSDADCATGCCAGREGSSTGACSAVLVAEEDGKTGCGFVQV